MASIEVSITVDESALTGQVQPMMTRRMAALKRRTATQARADVPVLTGNLGRNIGEGPTEFTSPLVATGSVHARTEYAAAVHEGSRPHVIRPRRAKALRFDVGGRTVYARLVRHPGTRARPFLRNAGMRVAQSESGNG